MSEPTKLCQDLPKHLRRRGLSALLAAIALAGCATAPSDIRPRDTDHTPYLSLSCLELFAMVTDTDAELRDMTAAQEHARIADALVLPGLSRLTGKNRRNVDDISRLSGQLVAVQTAQNVKCR